MTMPNLRGFLAQNPVAISFDLSSPVSKISPSVAYNLDLAVIFTELGDLACTATLAIPTLDGHYSSNLDLVIGYSLPAYVVLGADWVLPCHPILNEDGATLQPLRSYLVDGLLPPHGWYPIAGMLRHRIQSHPACSALTDQRDQPS